ncbi:hypothetical protein D3C74_268900 [compost metagenome]
MNTYYFYESGFTRILGWFKRKHYYFDRVCKFLPLTNMRIKHQHDRPIHRTDRCLPIRNRRRGDVGVLV